MAFPRNFIATHPLSESLVRTLNLSHYQLLLELEGVGLARIDRKIFLILASDEALSTGEAHRVLPSYLEQDFRESDLELWVQLVSRLAYLRLSGWKLAPEHAGMLNAIRLINPHTGAAPLIIPPRHPGSFFKKSLTIKALSKSLESLQAPATNSLLTEELDEEQRYNLFLHLALEGQETDIRSAIRIADRAQELTSSQPQLSNAQALDTAHQELDI